MKKILIIILIGVSGLLSAQRIRTGISFNQSSVKELEQLLPDSIETSEISFYKDNLLQNLYVKGYFQATVSPVIWPDSVLFKIDASRAFHFGQITWQTPEGFVLPALQDANPYQKTVTQNQWQQLVDRYLDYYENQGYPFVQLKIIEARFLADTLHATVALNPGPFTTIDSLVIKGFDKFSSSVIKYDLGFRKKQPYQESYLQKLEQRIQQVEYLRFARPPGIVFFKDKTTLFLYTEKVAGNQISGVAGINTKENGDITFNGDFELRLLNSFRGGEDLQLRWRRPDDNQQFLNVSLTLPYLFKTPFWINGGIEILRQDSSFVNTKLQGNLKYLLSGRNFLVAGIDYTSSNTLQSDIASTAFNGFKSYRYKAGTEINQTDRILIPTRGYILNLLPFSGSRSTADTTTRQYGWNIETALYTKVYKRHHILNRIKSETLFGTGLYENELYRIGGLKSMRGFNEQSIFSSAYGIYTLEYRYFFGTYDYLTAFGDLAYVQKKTIIEDNTNWLTGLGAGINFNTKGGIFSMFFAVGKTQNTPFDFRTVKVHFGYVNRF